MFSSRDIKPVQFFNSMTLGADQTVRMCILKLLASYNQGFASPEKQITEY